MLTDDIQEIEDTGWLQHSYGLNALQADLDALIGESQTLLTPSDILAEESMFFDDPVPEPDPEPEFDPDKYRSDDVREEG
jgi:hypothetical protein